MYHGLNLPCVSISRFPLYYELKIAFVIWLLSPYTRGASLIYRKCLHPLLSSRERVHPSVHPRVMQVTLVCSQFNCVLKCNCLPLGNRWVHCAGQREKLWDHGELWQAGPEHCSHRCGHCSRQGKLLFFYLSRECTTVLCWIAWLSQFSSSFSLLCYRVIKYQSVGFSSLCLQQLPLSVFYSNTCGHWMCLFS